MPYYVISNRKYPFESPVKAIRFACCQAIMHGEATIIDGLGDRLGRANFFGGSYVFWHKSLCRADYCIINEGLEYLGDFYMDIKTNWRYYEYFS
jgi:hypothetical protein